jgi:hypothetical protein
VWLLLSEVDSLDALDELWVWLLELDALDSPDCVEGEDSDTDSLELLDEDDDDELINTGGSACSCS